MNRMNNSHLIDMQDHRERGRRTARAAEAERRLLAAVRRQQPVRRGGRAWINGTPTSEGDRRLDYLVERYD